MKSAITVDDLGLYIGGLREYNESVNDTNVEKLISKLNELHNLLWSGRELGVKKITLA